MSQGQFTVVHSILDGADFIRKVCVHYPIGQVTECKLYKTGLHDTYLIITDTNQYILRVYRHHWQNQKAINFELKVLDFLRQHQQPIAYPLTRHDGKLITEVWAPEGKRYVVLFVYPQGKVIKRKLDVVQSYLLGRSLANIHNCLDNFPYSYQQVTGVRKLNTRYLLDWSIKGISNVYPHRPEQIKFLKTTNLTLKRQIQQLNLPAIAPEFGLCLGDVHTGNVLFNNHNQVTWLDFEQCGYGWRIFDIAKFLQTSIEMKIDFEVRNCFVDGYQDVRELSDGELAAIPVFVKVAHIWMMGIATHMVGNVKGYADFDDDWLDTKLATLEQWSL